MQGDRKGLPYMEVGVHEHVGETLAVSLLSPQRSLSLYLNL